MQPHENRSLYPRGRGRMNCVETTSRSPRFGCFRECDDLALSSVGDTRATNINAICYIYGMRNFRRQSDKFPRNHAVEIPCCDSPRRAIGAGVDSIPVLTTRYRAVRSVSAFTHYDSLVLKLVQACHSWSSFSPPSPNSWWECVSRIIFQTVFGVQNAS